MSQKLYLNILKFGVYLSLIVIFFVFKNLLFPFITSKQLAFNVLIEALFILWVGFIIKYPEYRPKKHYTWFGLVAFFIAMIISSIFGVDWNLSFWGDIERMLGVFHILHFLAFYFIIVTVMRSWRDWKIFYIISVAIAVIVSIQVDTGDSYGTIGNTAYVSGYLIFNMYFSLLLLVREKNKGLKWLYLIPFFLMFPGFLEANTTGAWVGLGFSIIVLLFLYGVLNKNKKLRLITLAGFLLATLFVVNFIILNRDNFITQRSLWFRNLTNEINLNKRTFQTRLVSWRAAIKAFPEHPIIGIGHGNYATVFDKYFDPIFFNSARGETYFDRAHNNVIDIASTSGLLGLITYLSIFGAIGYYLIRGYIKDQVGMHEFAILGALLSGYFVQNLAVFDSLVTYMGLMITLAYIYWIIELRGVEVEIPHDEPLNNREIYALVGAGLIILTVMYQFNIKPWNMLIGTIDGQRAYAQKNISLTFETYKRALANNTVLDRDSRTSMIRLLISNPNLLKKVERKEAIEILDFVLEMSRRNLELNPEDSLSQMMHAQIASAAANFYKDDKDKFSFYFNQALEAIDKSIEATPGRTPVYFQKAQLQINQGNKEGTIATLRYAASLNERDERGHCQLGRALMYFQETEEAYKTFDSCIDEGGANNLSPANFVKQLINHYSEANDQKRMISLFMALTNNLEKKNIENYVKLAMLYAQTGDKEKARETVEKAVEIDPSIRQYADEFLAGL